MLRRRQEAMKDPSCPLYLEYTSNYTKRHNEARKRLHAVPSARFRELLADCYTELIRRYPQVVTSSERGSRDEPRDAPIKARRLTGPGRRPSVEEEEDENDEEEEEEDEEGNLTPVDFGELQSLLDETKAFALAAFRLAKPDPARDWLHVERVRRLSLLIADTVDFSLPPSVPNSGGSKAKGRERVDRLVVEVAALLHDVGPQKEKDVGPLLARHKGVLDSERARRVRKIVEVMAWSGEAKGGKLDETFYRTCLELHW